MFAIFGALSAIGSIASLFGKLLTAIEGWFMFHMGAVSQENKDRGAEVAIMTHEQEAIEKAPTTTAGVVDEMGKGEF